MRADSRGRADERHRPLLDIAAERHLPLNARSTDADQLHSVVSGPPARTSGALTMPFDLDDVLVEISRVIAVPFRTNAASLAPIVSSRNRLRARNRLSGQPSCFKAERSRLVPSLQPVEDIAAADTDHIVT